MRILGAALVLWVACGGPPPPPPKPPPQPPPRPVAAAPVNEDVTGSKLVLIDAGAEPRQKLRYHFVAGTTEWLGVDEDTVVTMTPSGAAPFTVPMPPVRLRLRIDDKGVNDAGDLEYEGRIEGVDIDGGSSLRNKLRASIGPLVGLRFSGVVTSRGMAKKFTLQPPSVPDAKEFVERATQQLNHIVDPLPDEEVGVGARWTLERRVTSQGSVMSVRKSEHTLRALSATAIVVDGVLSETAEPQPIATKNGLQIARLLHYAATGDETAEVQLSGLASCKGRARMVANMDVSVTANGETRTGKRTSTTEVTFGPIAPPQGRPSNDAAPNPNTPPSAATSQ